MLIPWGPFMRIFVMPFGREGEVLVEEDDEEQESPLF